MSIFYKAQRVGKGGKPFTMYKLRTLKYGSDKHSFASEERYIKGGRLLRKFRIDEIPQLWNMLRGDMALVGPRPEEQKVIDLYPEHIKNKLLSIKPGLFGLSAIYFMDEEAILRESDDQHRDYWEKLKPMKLTLDFFYIENRCFSLNVWIIWQAIKVRLKTAWTTYR